MQALPVRLVEERFYGYNDNLPVQDIPPGFFAKADNVLLSDNKIVKVPGSTTIAASIDTRAFQGLAVLENYNSASKFIVAAINGASNATWYSWSGSGNFAKITGSDVMTNDKPFFFEQANNILFGLNGTEVGDWDGTTFTHNRAGVPLGKYLSWFHNYLFIANTATNTSRLFWSNLGDPTTFSGSNFVDINPGDGDQITGLGVLGDNLIVFKRETIWSISGFSGSTFSATTIAAQNTNNRIIGYGCIAAGSIVSTGNDIYFLSFVGNVPHIRSLKVTQYATTIGGGVLTYDIAGTMGGINLNALSAVQGIFDGRYIHWALPTGASTTPNKVITFDTFNILKGKQGKIFYPFTSRSGINPTYFTTSTISGSSKVYFTDSGTTGLVFKIDSSVHSDNGNAIVMDVITRGYMPIPARKHKWKYVYLKYDTGNAAHLLVYAILDNQSPVLQRTIYLGVNQAGLDSFILDTNTLGGGTSSYARVDVSHMIGKIMQFEFYETSTFEQTLYDYEIYAIPKALRADFNSFQNL